MDVYRTPDERFDGLTGYAFEPHYVEQDVLRVHYVDEGSGDPVLLLHGEPTWSFLYRKMVPVLSGSARAIAPDYVGFGRSDKPVERDWYTYDAHYAVIERLVETLALEGITVVVQDWGGPIGLRLAVEHPERVARLVIMNTGVYSGRPPSEAWLQFRDFIRRVGTEIRPGQLVRITCPQPIADDVVAGYDAPFPVPESKTGVLMFPELVPTDPEHPSAAKTLEVREAMKRWDKPALVLFGDSDPVFRPKVAERFSELIPGAGTAEFVEGAGHFLQEDKGEQIAERIARFVAES
jgi:haloalkane dehalogenase